MKKYKEIIFIFAFSFFVYAFSFNNQFLWDDEEQIVANVNVHNLKNLPQLFTKGIVYIPGRELAGGFYRPIVSLAYMLLYAIGKGSPFVFRLFQVTLHGLNSVLVYFLFLRLLKTRKISFVLSAIFAIHPGISEAVLFMSGLGEPLYFFFLLTAFLFFLNDRFYLLSLFCFMTALLTKEAAVVLFLLIIIYLLLFPSKKLKAPIILSYFWTILIYIYLRIIIVGGLVANLNFPSLIGQAPILTRVLTTPYSISFYLFTFLYPVNLAISNQTVVRTITSINFWLPFLFILLVIFLIFYLYRKIKSRLFLFFIMWFLVGLLPILNIVPLSSTVAERWLYFPIIGILGFLAVLIPQRMWNYKKLITVGFILYISLLSIRTIIRTSDWKNGYTLYKHDISINPNSFELQNNYGVELFRKGEIGKSKQYFQKSVELNPGWWTNFNNLGVIYEKEEDYKKASELYQKSIDNGNYFLAYKNLAQIYLKTKDYNNANILLEKAVQYFSYDPVFHRFYAISLYQTNQYELALKEAQFLVKLEPSQENYNLWQLISKKEKLPEVP